VKLDEHRYSTRRAVASPQVLHASVENCFNSALGEKERKLWRLDRLRGNLYLLLLSHEKPDFINFCGQYCAEGVQEETKDYNNLLARIQLGQRWRFRLRANAVHSVMEEKGKRGKVYAHVTVEQQRDWLMKKSQLCGFGLDERLFDVVETDHLRFRRAGQKAPVIIGVAVFEGELEVLDVTLFTQALTQGVGRAKAYGCGLLTIAGRL